MIFGSIQGFVFSLSLLAIKSPKSVTTNRLFSLLIFVVSLFLLITSQNAHFDLYPKLFLLSLILFYWYCPLYDLVTQSIVSEGAFKLTRQHFIHIVPSALFAMVMFRYLIMPTDEVLTRLANKNYVDLLLADLFSISMNLYFIWKGWRTMMTYSAESLSHPKDWVFTLLSVAFSIANVAWFYYALWDIGLPLTIPPYLMQMVYVSMSFLIFAFGYFIVIRSEHFSIQTAIQSIRYRNVNIDQAVVTAVEKKLIEVLETTKAYKNANFSLQNLADLARVDKFKVSYTINNAMNTNFTSLVNKYRVAEFIKLASSNDYGNFNMLGIAVEAGFSSKSTFYKAFKELKGQSPKEYFASKPAEMRK